MSTLGQLGNFWIPWITTIVLLGFSDAVAQTSNIVTDLGLLNNNDNLSCAMALHNPGWTLSAWRTERIPSLRALSAIHAACSSLRRVSQMPYPLSARLEPLS